MSTLTLSSIKKCYPNGFQAIEDINLSIKDGEFVVLVGPSGCGKSTLLRMIAGLEEISSGELCIDDNVVNLLEPSERDIAMVFQNYALYPHMTVYNNMAYGLKNLKMPKDQIKELVTKTSEMLELSHLLDRKPKELSGGQRQRVAMGRAIVRQPKVFLFDEPLSNLDAKLRVQMRLEIKRLQKSMKTTSIYVTHDQVEAMTLADKLVVLNKGDIEQVATPLEIYDRPESTFVATFMGSPAMNIVDGAIESGNLMLAGCERKTLQGNNVNFEQIKFGLRPEHLFVDEETPWFHVQVDIIEALGADLLLYCQVMDAPEKFLVMRVDGHERVQMGDTFGVNVKLENCHFFDSETERRIEPFNVTSLNTKLVG